MYTKKNRKTYTCEMYGKMENKRQKKTLLKLESTGNLKQTNWEKKTLEKPKLKIVKGEKPKKNRSGVKIEPMKSCVFVKWNKTI